MTKVINSLHAKKAHTHTSGIFNSLRGNVAQVRHAHVWSALFVTQHSDTAACHIIQK
jgi:hypothetical protein